MLALELKKLLERRLLKAISYMFYLKLYMPFNKDEICVLENIHIFKKIQQNTTNRTHFSIHALT